MSTFRTYEEFCTANELIAPPGLTAVLASDVATRLDGLLYRPDRAADSPPSLRWALDLLNDAAQAPPPNLLPLVPVDDASIACVVCAPAGANDGDPDAWGQMVRWHLNDIDRRFQGALLDIDAESYLRSVADELAARKPGLRLVKKISEKYQRDYVSANKSPRGWVTRPVQLACQNVIIGLSAFQHDATFDGLRVPVYLSCEVPHLATHEANRALAALMLCDAFQNGGTLEIRFGMRSREESVPPGLRRFGRTVGVPLGIDDQCAITPPEARELFLAVTPMPDELWARAINLMDRGLISPERLCYALLVPLWRDIELDYLLATSARAVSILEGGAPANCRAARQAELEAARAALMAGMCHRRINNDDRAGRPGEVRVFEDSRVGVEWTVNGDDGIVAFTGVPSGPLAWSSPGRTPVTVGDSHLLLVVPRALPIPMDWECVRTLQATAPKTSVALLTPIDMADTVPSGVPLLVCPDRLGELDWQIEARLQKSRISRA